MALQYKDGFIVGERRAKEMAEGIKNTEDNTKQILEVLIGQFRELQSTISISGGNDQSKRIDLRHRARQANAATDQATKQTAKQIAEVIQSAVEDGKKNKRDRVRDAITVNEAIEQREQAKAKQHREQIKNSVQERVERERDANGRFIGAGNSGESDKKGIVSSIKDYISGAAGGLGGVAASGRGVDPTLDAIGELKDTLGPMGGIFKKMTVKGIGLFTGRRKKNPADEAIPAEQAKDNEIDQKSDKERNGLLRRLIDATMRGGGSGGMLGGLGRLFGGGKGGKGLMRGLLRKIPILGALLGGGALAMNWGKSNNKERGEGIGGIAGMVAGGAIGSMFGPIGTVLGGVLGHKLGGIFGKKVGEWTDELKNIDFGELFTKAVSGAFNFIKDNNPVSNTINTAKNFGGWVKEKFSGGQGVSRSSGNTSSGAGYGGGNGAAAGSTRIASNKTREKRQLMMYDALRKAGFSNEQALAIGGEIGRENDYSDIMFSTHTDPAKDRNGKDIKNGGVLSWNRERYAKFQKHMQSKGLMNANGKMPETQATLDAQAEFIKWEMENTHKNAGGGAFLSNPNLDPKNAAVPLAKYIGWARGQTTIKGKNGRVPFNSKPHEQKINGYIDKGRDLIANRGEAAAPQLKDAKTATAQQQAKPKATITKAPQIEKTVIPLKPGAEKPQTARAQDTQLGQNVSDRSMAHIYTGGIGRHLG